MKQTIPGAIGFHVIEHDWAVWSSIAHLAFGKLTLHAPPNVCPSLSLQKLPAIDRGVLEDMFDNMTRIALKHIGVLRIHGDDTFGALSVTASPSCVSQILLNEVTLRPSQLLLFCGTARAGTSVQHRLVHGMPTLGCLFPGAEFAADVTGRAREVPLGSHVLREL